MHRRILLSCFYFSPYRGGEAAVGWKYATGIAETHDVTVLYGDLSAALPMKQDLDRYLAEQPLPARLQIEHVAPDPKTIHLHGLHARPGLWFLYYRAYQRWQRLALKRAKELHAEHPFDAVHQLTIIGYREPGYLWQLGIPFFWGPINGAASMPLPYLSGFGLKGFYRHLTRNVFNAIQMRLSRRCRQVAATATQIWTVTKEDQQMVEKIWGYPATPMIETGATPVENPTHRTLAPGEPLRLIWCGIIEDRKALHLAIQALAQLTPTEHCELHVIGDGPDRTRCEALAASLGVATAIHWHGRVTHDEVQHIMSRGHALIHSAVKEGTPHVVLEALAQAMPVICHDSCGMGVAVDETSGLKIPMQNPQTSIHGFRDAIRHLLQHPDTLGKLSHGAYLRAQQQSWKARIDTVTAAYHLTRSPRP